MITTMEKLNQEHIQNLKNKHSMYCPVCDKFVMGTMTDAGVYGYNLICPIHGNVSV